VFLHDISHDISINTGDTEWHHSVSQYYTCMSAEDQDFVVSILQRAATLYERKSKGVAVHTIKASGGTEV